MRRLKYRIVIRTEVELNEFIARLLKDYEEEGKKQGKTFFIQVNGMELPIKRPMKDALNLSRSIRKKVREGKETILKILME